MAVPGRLRSAIVLIGLLAVACSGADPAAEDASEITDGDPVVAESASDAGRPAASANDRDGGEDDEPVEEAFEPPDGVLVWAVATEPPDLHLDDPANGLTITSWIREGLLESLFGIGPDLTYHPELLAAEPTVTPQDDASVVIAYRLRDDLTWSDGTALTSADVAYTHEILTEGCRVEGDGSILDNSNEDCLYRSDNRLGYDQVTAFEVVSETEFTVTMASFYPDWRRLYGPVLAAHAFGEDARQVNQRLQTMSGPGGPLPSSGPLVFDRWERGVAMTLTTNPSYHGSTAPQATTDGPASFDAVRIDFLADPTTRLGALVDGRADLVMERARPGHEVLAGADEVTVEVVAGVDYDHVGLNLLNPHLADPQVRAAVALAIDKAAVAASVFGPLLGDGIEVAEQGNTYWLASQPEYVDHQVDLTGGGPDAVRVALAAADYEPGDDGVQRHPTRGLLRLRMATIGGDPLRELAQEVLIDQFAEVGIAVTADNEPGGLFFQQGPFDPEAMAASASQGSRGDAGLWDMAQFAWAGGPWPGAQSGAYRNGSPGNPYGFSNPEFEVAAFECDAVVDDAERAGCYNDLDRFVTTLDNGDDGLFMLPLFQRPVVVAHRSDRIDALPAVVGSPRVGPLATITDLAMAGG